MTADLPVPDHLLTVDEWDGIEESEASRQYELVDGVLVVSPRALPLHQIAAYRLAAMLDAGMKFAEYQEAGIPSYWVIDPDAAAEARFVAYDLVDGVYVEAARGGDSAEVRRPAPMTVDVGGLLRLD
ncbi:putative restriction endonuclease [Haloactinopolyspora alba]|uniref:Putative restriction endonuclease n=2 Tax=Haloactinopolyspora alba TaxID=648780 RepID=A0A2P8DLW1_9ACTN|nr:putative restriction endonuclease [Haloactinopolyspora alba]